MVAAWGPWEQYSKSQSALMRLGSPLNGPGLSPTQWFLEPYAVAVAPSWVILPTFKKDQLIGDERGTWLRYGMSLGKVRIRQDGSLRQLMP